MCFLLIDLSKARKKKSSARISGQFIRKIPLIYGEAVCYSDVNLG